MKPLYALDNASRKFLLWVKDVFLNKLALKTVEGVEAFYFRNIIGRFCQAVFTHVDDFEVAGTPEFVEEIISVVEIQLTVSKVEEDTFCYTGLAVKVITDGREVSMAEYLKSLKDITDARKTDDRSEPLTKLEMKL